MDIQTRVVGIDKTLAQDKLKKCGFSNEQVTMLINLLSDTLSVERFNSILRNLCLISELEPKALKEVDIRDLFSSATNPKSNLFPIPLKLRKQKIGIIFKSYSSLFRVYGETTIESTQSISNFSKLIEDVVKNSSLTIQQYLDNFSKVEKKLDALSKFYNYGTRQISTEEVIQQVQQILSPPAPSPSPLEVSQASLTKLSSTYDMLSNKENRLNGIINMYEVYMGSDSNILKWEPWDWISSSDKQRWETMKQKTIKRN